MKKIFFAAVMLVTIGVITAMLKQTPAKDESTTQKETIKRPSSSVGSVAPTHTPKKNTTASSKLQGSYKRQAQNLRNTTAATTPTENTKQANIQNITATEKDELS